MKMKKIYQTFKEFFSQRGRKIEEKVSEEALHDPSLELKKDLGHYRYLLAYVNGRRYAEFDKRR